MRRSRSSRASRPRGARFGLFVEGATPTNLVGTVALRQLWEELARLSNASGSVVVHGFDKSQIVSLKEDPRVRLVAPSPLDIFIDQRYRDTPFDVLVVAFDALPPNQLLNHSCMRSEVDFVLRRMVERKHLPRPFAPEAERLLKHYDSRPQQPRGRGRPPRGAFDVIYMEPVFESLLIADEAAVRRALGHARTPKDWPTFSRRVKRPDRTVLPRAVSLAAPDARTRVGGTFDTNKHGWALAIVREAARGNRFAAHPIARRLRDVLA